MPHFEETSHAKVQKKTTHTSTYLMGGAFAGGLEIALFHPADTIAKRLQRNVGKVTSYSQVIFPHLQNAPVIHKAASLWQGIGFAAGYKILQRTIKFGGQPIVDNKLEEVLSPVMQDKLGVFGRKGLAGALSGLAELIILPLDNIKIKIQTGGYSWQGLQHLGKFVMQERFGLYNGAVTTAMRNAPGSFLLFGTEAWMKDLMGIKSRKDETLAKKIAASTVASVASVVGTVPLDVVKTRIQAESSRQTVKALPLMAKMLRQEGVTSFFKGSVVKALAAAPKVTFAMVAAPMIVSAIAGEDEADELALKKPRLG